MNLLDVVALTEDIPARGLRRGQVGTIVEILGPEVFEVEFADNDGRTYATLSLHSKQLMVLHYQAV
jgi:sulfur transfer complex TusBCD TusB component (DsrH family)